MLEGLVIEVTENRTFRRFIPCPGVMRRCPCLTCRAMAIDADFRRDVVWSFAGLSDLTECSRGDYT